MASDREIEQVRKDTERWRSLLRQILRYEDQVAPRHAAILDSLSEKQNRLEELSYRQAEWLLDIRDETQTITHYRDVSVRYLIKSCYENRLDLDEDDEGWVIELYKRGRSALRKYEAIRLYSLARQLGDVND